MSEAIEKAITEAASKAVDEMSADWLDSRPVLEAALRSLVDAVLEEAARAARARWTRERDIATQNGLAAGCLAASGVILALKSQPTGTEKS